MTATKGSSPWYNFFGDRYTGNEPSFYDPQDFPWAAELERNWDVIHQELLAFLARGEKPLKPYFINKGMSFPPRQWKTMGFYFWKLKAHKNCRACPRTVEILNAIPHMTAGSLSVLEPGGSINPHQGDTDAILRIHLGLEVPAGLPDCGFQVGREVRPWREGKTLIFCDAQTHTAWNQSTRRRLILIVDVMRDEFAGRTDEVCSHVLASSLMQMLYGGQPWLNRLPGSVKQLLYFVSRMAIRVIVPIQRRLG